MNCGKLSPALYRDHNDSPLFTTIMSWLMDRMEPQRHLGECKVPCVVSTIFTTHVTQAKVSVCFCVHWISLILSGGSERMVLLQLCECVSA